MFKQKKGKRKENPDPQREHLHRCQFMLAESLTRSARYIHPQVNYTWKVTTVRSTNSLPSLRLGFPSLAGALNRPSPSLCCTRQHPLRSGTPDLAVPWPGPSASPAPAPPHLVLQLGSPWGVSGVMVRQWQTQELCTLPATTLPLPLSRSCFN